MTKLAAGPLGGASQVVSGTDVNLVNRFVAMQYGSNSGYYDYYSPPDPQLAVGPTEVVEMVNVHEEIFTKSGSSVNVIPLSTVFGAGTDDIGDPRVVYDNSSGRFFASVFDFTGQDVLVAASKSTMADNGWYYYTLPTYLSGVCVDQPTIGVSTDKVVVTGNDYFTGGPTGSPCRPLGNAAYQEVWVINKAEMSAGAYTYWHYYYWPWSSSGWFSMRPVTSTTSTAYIVCDTCGSGILLEQVNGVPDVSSSPTLTPVTLPFAPPPSPPDAPHGGNSDLIDVTAGGTRIWSTAWANGIWITLNDGCVPAGDVVQRSCIRLVHILVSPAQVVANIDVYGPPGFYLYYGAVTGDSFGGIGLVAGYSNSTLYPSVLVTGLKSGEAFGSLETNLVTVTRGTGYYCHFYRYAGICRYGDYFGASSDPSDPSAMWFVGEYETSNGWSTSITTLRMGLAAVSLGISSQDGSVPSQTTTVSYTRAGAALTGTLSATPSTFYIDLGTWWTAGSSLGGTASERWAAQGTVRGQVSQDGPAFAVYYHQFLVTPSFSVTGGGTGYQSPSVSCTQFGSAVSTSTGSPVWADAKSTCNFALTLPGSTVTERWAPASAGVTVSGSGSISENYYHQYLYMLSYATMGGGTPTAPSLTSTQFGSPYAPTLTTTASGYWLDSGTACSITNPTTGSTSTERWYTGVTCPTVSASQTIGFNFYHQYFVTGTYAVLGGGLLSPPTLSYTALGAAESTQFATSVLQVWVDAGASISATNPLAGSSSTERWFATGTTGTVASAAKMALSYYHQYSVSFSYSVVGGGSPGAPTLSASALGSPLSQGLSTSPTSIWVDAGQTFSITTTLPGSGSSERWVAATGTSGTITSSTSVQPAFHHQYLLSATGATAQPTWFESGSVVSYNIPKVFGRAAGSGSRVVSYSLDGGADVLVTPTTGNVTVTVAMNGPHTVLFKTVAQYQLGISSQCSMPQATSPTTPNDNYWYDAGTSVTVACDGSWARGGGSGMRATEYDWDGGSPTSVASAGRFTTQVTMNSPHTLEVQVTLQYQLTVSSGYLLSVTITPISEDTGWYDSGTQVQARYNLTWNEVAQASRTIATGYSVDGGSAIAVSATPNGVFVTAVTMSAPHTIDVKSLTQYYLAVLSPYGNPTGGGWYSAGSSANVAVQSPFQTTNDTRYVFIGFSGTGSAPQSGNSTSVSFDVSSPSSITIQWGTQYHVSATTAMGSVNGTGWYDKGSAARIQVSPISTGFLVQQVFKGWAEAVKVQGGVSTLTVRGPIYLHAVWGTDYTQLIAVIVAAGGFAGAEGFFWRRRRGRAATEQWPAVEKVEPPPPPPPPPAEAAPTEFAVKAAASRACA